MSKGNAIQTATGQKREEADTTQIAGNAGNPLDRRTLGAQGCVGRMEGKQNESGVYLVKVRERD
jgi:hypothetical protein